MLNLETEQQILVIDDEDDIREVAQCLETLGGWDVITANYGTEGLVTEKAHPDAILLDFTMPTLDGLTTFQKLQANSHLKANCPSGVSELACKIRQGNRAWLPSQYSRGMHRGATPTPKSILNWCNAAHQERLGKLALLHFVKG
jgi:CheY-like chemotaxis protein